eukprot:7359362-Prymnesium_polylepis.2
MKFDEPPPRSLRRLTKISGQRRHQLIRTASGSSLLLRRLNLMDGHAGIKPKRAGEFGSWSLGGESERARASSGGAVMSLGNLLCYEVGFQRNTADNGGSIYFEGKQLEMHVSVVEESLAKFCGGGVYLAASAAYLHRVTLYDNDDSCRTKFFADDMGHSGLEDHHQDSSLRSWALLFPGHLPVVASWAKLGLPFVRPEPHPVHVVGGSLAQGPNLVHVSRNVGVWKQGDQMMTGVTLRQAQVVQVERETGESRRALRKRRPAAPPKGGWIWEHSNPEANYFDSQGEHKHVREFR